MLVVVMLSAVGIVALNAASYDVASAGAIRQGTNAVAVSEMGLGVCRTEVCRSLDAVTLAMKRVRETQGRPPEYVMRDVDLEARLDVAPTFFELPSGSMRGSFGTVGATPPATPFAVAINRPREDGTAAGFSMRESAGADAASLCFRRYQLTSDGSYAPPGVVPPHGTTKSQFRANLVAGPVECSM